MCTVTVRVTTSPGPADAVQVIAVSGVSAVRSWVSQPLVLVSPVGLHFTLTSLTNHPLSPAVPVIAGGPSSTALRATAGAPSAIVSAATRVQGSRDVSVAPRNSELINVFLALLARVIAAVRYARGAMPVNGREPLTLTS